VAGISYPWLHLIPHRNSAASQNPNKWKKGSNNGQAADKKSC
jgi:hypothetical protein